MVSTLLTKGLPWYYKQAVFFSLGNKLKHLSLHPLFLLFSLLLSVLPLHFPDFGATPYLLVLLLSVYRDCFSLLLPSSYPVSLMTFLGFPDLRSPTLLSRRECFNSEERTHSYCIFPCPGIGHFSGGVLGLLGAKCLSFWSTLFIGSSEQS